MVEAYNERTKREYEEKITLAYASALWTAQWQSKEKPPTLDEVLGRKKQTEEMTDEQMLNQVIAIHKKMGGE